MTHLIFRKRRKPFLAIPVNGTLRLSLAAIGCLPSFTFKRKLYKYYVLVIVLTLYYPLKILRLQRSNFEIVELSSWCKSFLDKFSVVNHYHVIIWSLVPNRERFYLHILGENGNPFWFAKLTSNKRDSALLVNEADKISYLRKFYETAFFETPKVIDSGDFTNLSYVVFDYLATDERLFHPAKNELPLPLLNSIRGEKQRKELQDVLHLEWWHAFELVRSNYSKLSEYIDRIGLHTIVTLSFVHGDFGSENILMDSGGNFKVIDWERSHFQGPYIVDEVAFWLGRNHREIKGKSRDVVSRFYLSFQQVPKIDLGLALCFLVGAKFDLAIIISKHWNFENEDTFR